MCATLEDILLIPLNNLITQHLKGVTLDYLIKNTSAVKILI